MSREIKLRVWGKTNKEFVERCYLSNDGLFLLVFSGKVHGFIELKEYEINQYTGLKDKNENEIYEGDIVFYDGGKEKEIVEWRSGWHPFTMSYVPGYNDYFCASPKHFEVVGNIYQNPELLEKE